MTERANAALANRIELQKISWVKIPDGAEIQSVILTVSPAERDRIVAALRTGGNAQAPRQPTEAMLNAARDWSREKYGKPIGSDGAIGCWQAMFDASLVSSTHQSAPVDHAPHNSGERLPSSDAATAGAGTGKPSNSVDNSFLWSKFAPHVT